MRGRKCLADHLFYRAPSVIWMRAGRANPTLLGHSVGQPALIARPHHDAATAFEQAGSQSVRHVS